MGGEVEERWGGEGGGLISRRRRGGMAAAAGVGDRRGSGRRIVQHGKFW
jgi:hypothetical protein